MVYSLFHYRKAVFDRFEQTEQAQNRPPCRTNLKFPSFYLYHIRLNMSAENFESVSGALLFHRC